MPYITGSLVIVLLVKHVIEISYLCGRELTRGDHCPTPAYLLYFHTSNFFQRSHMFTPYFQNSHMIVC